MTISKLSIPRNKWARGWLRYSDGSMCCLGHLSKACGVPVEEMDSPFPQGEWVNQYSLPYWAVPKGKSLHNVTFGDVTSGDLAASINDDTTLSSSEREQELIKLFASTGIELSFEGEYTDYSSDPNSHFQEK